MEKILRILSGLNRSAEVAIQPGVPLVVGTHPDCSVVLADIGVANFHCRVIYDPQVSSESLCMAINANIQAPSRWLKPGEAMRIADRQIIQCGPVSFAIGDRSCDWKKLEGSLTLEAHHFQGGAIGHFRRLTHRMHAMTPRKRAIFAALAATGFMGSVSLVYAALFPSPDVHSQAYLEGAQRWLKSVTPAGGELKLRMASDGQLLLSGYVASNYQNELLSQAANDSMYRPRMEVYAVEQMVTSLSRLANLENLPCIASYLSAGKLGCNNEIANTDHATRLQALARQISGVKALELRMRPTTVIADNAAPAADDAAPPAKAEPPRQTLPSGFPSFARKLNVFISKRGRYVVDTRGIKFSEGDVIDGYTITSIELDQVQLRYGEQRFFLQMAAAQ